MNSGKMNRVFQSVSKISRSIQYLPKCSCTTKAQSGDFVVKEDVPGLSKKTVDVPSGEVGFPKASKSANYKNPEYFSYHNTSYYEAEVEMHKFRLPQPSNRAQ